MGTQPIDPHAPRCMTTEELFLEKLDNAMDFHRRNHNDPHGIGTAVAVALLETRNAWAAANKFPLRK